MAAEKSKERLAILAKIDEYERNGWFSKDVEDDPPTIPLEADQIDYTRKKLSSKINTFIANYIFGLRFINGLVKNHQMIIKDVVGLDNFIKLKDQGLILTCNHFNAFDNFAVFKVLEPYLKHKILWRVIREGNYTSFGGFYGYLFRNCNCLPLSSRMSTMKKFMEAVSELLGKGQKILVYAEQGMWWNYKKPRPLVPGAFKFAIKNNVPVLPLFITMTDSKEYTDGDGFPVQEYTVHILEPIYPDPDKSEKQNIEWMRTKNYEMWKEVYEKFYGIPLVYLQKEESSESDAVSATESSSVN